ncbi:MAG TPA: MFS transporter [Rectinemataceae bacterium]|nr:MFS transporter [Rectinemataceae bacterium]
MTTSVNAAEAVPTRTKLWSFGIISTGHTLNDLYSNFLPQMLPFLVVLVPGFGPIEASILVASFNIFSSLFQPIFGYMVDNKGRSWLVFVGTLWMAFFLSLTGLAPNFPLMVLFASLSGLGTAAFHPPASVLVNSLDPKRRALYQSGFVAFGNIGFALAPLLLVPLFQSFGLKATLFMVFPGMFASLLLFFALPRGERSAPKPSSSLAAVWRAIKVARRELLAILGVISIRSVAYTGLLAMLPLYFHSKNIPNLEASRMLTLMLFVGAIGGVTGGFLSDRFGRKPLIVGSLILATPLFFGFLATSGALSLVFFALGGAALLSSFSVTIVAAQEAIPDNKAMAAGLSLGFANGIGALAVVLIGTIGDLLGLGTAIAILFCLPLVSGLVGLLLKTQGGLVRVKS